MDVNLHRPRPSPLCYYVHILYPALNITMEIQFYTGVFSGIVGSTRNLPSFLSSKDY